MNKEQMVFFKIASCCKTAEVYNDYRTYTNHELLAYHQFTYEDCRSHCVLEEIYVKYKGVQYLLPENMRIGLQSLVGNQQYAHLIIWENKILEHVKKLYSKFHTKK
jgi:hypothetical protein